MKKRKWEDLCQEIEDMIKMKIASLRVLSKDVNDVFEKWGIENGLDRTV